MKGSRLNYSLTVVDTLGFGDTRGLEKDKKIMQQIQDYFQYRHGIQQLEAVCFVVQSSLSRLTATQQYIFDSILSIFGQDIKDNIRLMVTFADGALPPVLGAVKEAGIPSPMDPSTGLPLHHKFNNSIFFTSNKGDRQTNEFNRTYFDMAVGGFDKFFDDLGVMEAKSLTLTREVLEETKRLEALVEDLQMKTEIKLTRVDELMTKINIFAPSWIRTVAAESASAFGMNTSIKSTGAKNEAITNEKLLNNIQKEIDKYESQLMELMQSTYPCIQRLDEIALRPHPFSAPDYTDLMIAAEKQENRPGYQQRIATLQKLCEMAEMTAKLIRDKRTV
ncbi:hypothetical protein DAPPUDRAFT_119874 [Daphnia pulex]|uniref:AIG1-type G domain-containing protein n=1 Tax=Daphnia pulex TaxID=6669 RepID=E9HZQ1_DAPPU|nr:hypothetical protein DAPPUDRAFT_119874 [Daphnia pulex]|eukprot:EFX62780.1 hypothetical protein DAPPUDRAFT_119874 [Daphnia pulex]